MIKKNMRTTIYGLTALLLILSVSCNPSKKLQDEEDNAIQNYLAGNSNLDFVKKESGLYYLEVEEGTGISPVKHDTAYLKYTGKLLGGSIFDSNTETDDTLVIAVDEGWVIPGFDEGITYMKEGGKATFLVPSKLAYGAAGYYYIPGYTPLLFDVELVRLKEGPGK